MFQDEEEDDQGQLVIDLKTNNNKSRRSSALKVHRCKYCSKTFNKKHYLECHLRVHTGEQPYQCSYEQCRRKFSDKSNWKRHVSSMHLKQRKYECDYCGKKFAQSSNLKTHKFIHTGKRPFHCKTCPKQFIRKDHLISHTQKCSSKSLTSKKKLKNKNNKNYKNEGKMMKGQVLPFSIKKRFSNKTKNDKETTASGVDSQLVIDSVEGNVVAAGIKIEDDEVEKERAEISEKMLEIIQKYEDEDQVVPDSILLEQGFSIVEVTTVKIENDMEALFDNTPSALHDSEDQHVVPLQEMDTKPLTLTQDDEYFDSDVALNVTISQSVEVQQLREYVSGVNHQQNSPFDAFQYLQYTCSPSNVVTSVQVTFPTLSQELYNFNRYPSSNESSSGLSLLTLTD